MPPYRYAFALGDPVRGALSLFALGYIPLQHGLMLYGIRFPYPPIPFYQPL